MLDYVIPILFVAAGIVSALAIYIEQVVFKSAIALALTFTVVSLALLLLNQPVIAVLQLIVMVGGVSTYLIVAVASETRKRSWPTNMRVFAAIGFLVAMGVSYIAIPFLSTASTSPTNIYVEFLQTIQQYAIAIYFIVLLMFVAAMGSAVVIKELGD